MEEGLVMEMRWDLDEIFPSFESEKFQNSYRKFEDNLHKMNQWVEEELTTQEDPVRKMEEFVVLLNGFYNEFVPLRVYSRLRLSVEATNDKASQMLEKLETKSADLTQPKVKFQKWLGRLEDLEQLIASSELLEEHRLFFSNLAEDNKYTLSEEEELIISKMSTTGSLSWTKLQNLLTSTLTVEMEADGEMKSLPLPVVRNMAYHSDPKVRKAAYHAELKSYEKIAESSAACLNGIKGEVLTVTKMRGYDSTLEMTLLSQNMELTTLEAMLEAMRESLPAFQKYYRKKAEFLGYEGGLPFYEIFAPLSDAEKEYTYAEAREYIVKNFRTFDDALAEFVDQAFENRWIDAEPRQGKRGGAFCSNIQPLKVSRVMSNFNNSFSNVITLAHELGHAYHGHCLGTETFLNSTYPMPLAETASIFSETIVINSALKEATEEEAFAILESTISKAGQVIVDIYSRFLFESELFKRREDHSLSVNELKEIMLDAQKQAYGSGLDPEYLHPYAWANKVHYYYPLNNFYNYPYAFGLLFAKGIYSEYLKRGESFVAEYNELLRVSGKNSVTDVAKMAGMDVNSIDFWRSSLKLVAEDIERFVELCDTLKK